MALKDGDWHTTVWNDCHGRGRRWGIWKSKWTRHTMTLWADIPKEWSKKERKAKILVESVPLVQNGQSEWENRQRLNKGRLWSLLHTSTTWWFTFQSDRFVLLEIPLSCSIWSFNGLCVKICSFDGFKNHVWSIFVYKPRDCNLLLNTSYLYDHIILLHIDHIFL